MREEKARLERERDALYENWCVERRRHREISTAKRNIDALLEGKMNSRLKALSISKSHDLEL